MVIKHTFISGIREDNDAGDLTLYWAGNGQWLLFDGGSHCIVSSIGDAIREELEPFRPDDFVPLEWETAILRITRAVNDAVAGNAAEQVWPTETVGHMEAGVMASFGWPVYEADGEWFVGEKPEEE